MKVFRFVNNNKKNIMNDSNASRIPPPPHSDAAAHHNYDSTDFVVGRINFWIMLFGIIGNTVCLIVFMQKPLLNRKFNWYLIILACAELLFCSIVWANYLVFNLTETKFLYDLSVFTCILTDYIVYSIDAFCVFLTLTLSIDRLYAIMNPLKSRLFMTSRFPRRISFFICLFLVVVKLPELFFNQRLFIYTIPRPRPELVNATETNEPGGTSTVRSETPTTQPSYFQRFKANFVEVEYSKNSLGESSQRCTSLISFDMANNASANSSQAESSEYYKEVYVIYCNIFVPLILNILPAITILVLNMMLWIFIRRYTKSVSHDAAAAAAPAKRPSPVTIAELIPAMSPVSPFVRTNNSLAVLTCRRRPLTITQKSHYFTIIIIGIWLLITSAPYYTLNTYYWITTLRFIENKSRVPLAIQAISSTFFNSNHCLNIIIYLIFHKDFRTQSLKFFFKLFNMNPFVKLNPEFLKSMRNARASVNGSEPAQHPPLKKSLSQMDTKYQERPSGLKKALYVPFGPSKLAATTQDLASNKDDRTKPKLKPCLSMPSNGMHLLESKQRDDTNSSMDTNNRSSMSNRRLFIPNENVFLFRYLKKRRERAEQLRRQDLEQSWSQTSPSRSEFSSSLPKKDPDSFHSTISTDKRSSKKKEQRPEETVYMSQLNKCMVGDDDGVDGGGGDYEGSPNLETKFLKDEENVFEDDTSTYRFARNRFRSYVYGYGKKSKDNQRHRSLKVGADRRCRDEPSGRTHSDDDDDEERRPEPLDVKLLTAAGEGEKSSPNESDDNDNQSVNTKFFSIALSSESLRDQPHLRTFSAEELNLTVSSC